MVEVQQNTSEVRVKYNEVQLKYNQSTTKYKQSTSKVRTKYALPKSRFSPLSLSSLVISDYVDIIFFFSFFLCYLEV